ncbi:hypothetical protein DL771_006109 [Monosporascus sp. 5C6A]|nr:hypothetical protein DL771_006109 [Monosporascus sp. 5C6A]
MGTRLSMHGLQGHPYKTWTSDPAKHNHDEPLEQIPNRKKRGLHSIFSRKLKSDGKEKGKQASRTEQSQNGGDEGRNNVQQDEVATAAAEPGSHAEESLAIAIDDEKPFKKKDVYWPLDLLAQKCPQARISVYGYDTLIAGYARVNKDTLYQIAMNFFHELPLHRAGNLPTLFIAHSLGGLVVKEVLIMSSESREPDLKSIVATTAAVVFMGTPHKGSKQWASKGDKARKIASALFMDNNPALLDTLGLKNGELFRSANKFTQLWDEYNFTVKTYIEDRMSIGGEKIVPDESSLLGNLKEHAMSLTGGHSRICKFNGKNDTNWLTVGPQLKKYYQEAIASRESNEGVSTTEQPLQAEIYRSLLVQILRTPLFKEDASELVDTHESKLLSQEVQAHHEELCKVLKGLFRKPRLELTIMFIDAVDKCTDPDELVKFFQDIAPMAHAAKLKICFTSQQRFPLVDSQCEHIAIEDFNGGDIASYIEKRLPVSSVLAQEQRVSLQRSIEEKASGIFLWVVLVVDLLRGYLNRGRDVHFLHAVLDETPNQLTKLYRNIITRSLNSPIETRTLIHLMQWVLFSARPLALGEWHHVFAFIDNPSLRSIDEWKCSITYTDSDRLLLERIKRVCCGLVDVKDRQVPFRLLDTHSELSSLGAGAGSFESHQYIDVIHSSVRRFFLDEAGFALLDEQIKNPNGDGHAYIFEVCIRYCFLEEMKQAFNFEPQEERKTPYLAEPTETRWLSKTVSKADPLEQKFREAIARAVDDDEASEAMSLGERIKKERDVEYDQINQHSSIGFGPE